MAINSEPSSPEESPRQPFQFTLRTLFVVTLLVAASLGLGLHGVPLIGATTVTVILLRRREWRWAAVLVTGFLLLTACGFGTSVSVRLDTGDQRLAQWGIPVANMPMNSHTREALLSLNDPDVPARWVSCAQQVGSNYVPAMVRWFYYEAAAWVSEDPEIAKLVVRDIADYLQSTHGRRGLPECMAMLSLDVVDRDQHPAHVVDGWEENPYVL